METCTSNTSCQQPLLTVSMFYSFNMPELLQIHFINFSNRRDDRRNAGAGDDRRCRNVRDGCM